MNREPPGAERSSLENRLGASPQGFESLSLRQSKPESDTKVFDSGFSFENSV